VLGIVWILFWIPLYKKAPQLAEEEVAPERKIPWSSLLRVKQTWAYMIAKFLTDPVWWFYLIWLPDYFKKEQHLDIKAMGLPLVTLYGIVTVLSIFAGWAVKKIAERGYDIITVRKVSLLIFALCSLPIFFVRGLGMWEAVLLIGFAASAHQAWSASLYAVVSETFPRDAVASASGLGGMAGSVGGIIFPIVAGVILDSTANGYAILFAFCAFAYVTAFAIHHMMLPRLEKANI
jgi:ACS family hexuronate transporter-like MFS transporter